MDSQYTHYSETTLTNSGMECVLSLYNDSPDAPTVLFLPGTMVHPLFYDRFLSNIATSGLNVVGLHFIGHGKSPRTKEDFTFGDLVANAKAAIRFCQERYRGGLIVMGSSQGSMVATAAVAGDTTLRALFLHDLLLPHLSESMQIPSLPRFLRCFSASLPFILRMAATLFPTYQVPLQHYLDPKKLAYSDALVEQFLGDPLCRRGYPLTFIASLFNADLHCAVDGSIRIPLVMMTAGDDPLISQAYMDQVFDQLTAPDKEMMTFDLPYHTLFVEGVDAVSGPVIAKLRDYFDRTG